MATKRALLIGICAYRYVSPLGGCVNDLRLMRDLLAQRFGFQRMTCLVDAEGTRDAILAALDALVEQTERDDDVVMYFAGHGSQVLDADGDEASGMDNTLVPVDSGRDWRPHGESYPNRDITDDELHLRLAALGERTSYITVVVDACHSATITRDAAPGRVRGVAADLRPRSRVGDVRLGGAARRNTRGLGPSGWVPLSDKYVLIAACRDEEVAVEYCPPEASGDATHGALTYFLAQELMRAQDSGTTYRDVFERVAPRVTTYSGGQHPQIEGRVDRELFGIRELAPMRHVRVESRVGAVATLTRGAALGATAGSRYVVYGHGEKSTVEAEPVGEVEITAVRALTSDARVIQERTPGAVVAGTRAVERAHAWRAPRLPVALAARPEVDGELAATARVRLREMLAASPLFELVEPTAQRVGVTRVYLLGPQEAPPTGEPAPVARSGGVPTWVVKGEAGQLLASPVSIDSYVAVVRSLETIARHRVALMLDNADPDSGLRGKFTLELRRQCSDGTFAPVEPDPTRKLPILEEGDRVDVRIASAHDAPAHVYLLDIGLTGRVSLLFPPRHASDTIAAGHAFQVRRDGGKRPWVLELPRNFPFDAHAAPEGIETLKLFVTSAPVDFTFLEQEGTRSAVPAAERTSRVGRLLRAAFGAAARELADDDDGAREDWATVTRPFFLRRARDVSPRHEGGGTPSRLA